MTNIVIFLKRLWKNKWILRSCFSTIYFNFHYLPFNQAIKLPILLYKPTFGRLAGNVLIDSEIARGGVRMGMVKLGFNSVSLYPNSGIVFDNAGGSVVFRGSCIIGNNSAISVGNNGYLIFGDRFIATTTLKVVCYNKIVFGEEVLVGWNNLFMDTDFHRLTKVNGGYTKGIGEIFIGNNNWIANGCKFMKNSKTPNYSVFSSSMVVKKDLSSYPEFSVFDTQKEYVIRSGYWRDPNNDRINFSKD